MDPKAFIVLGAAGMVTPLSLRAAVYICGAVWFSRHRTGSHNQKYYSSVDDLLLKVWTVSIEKVLLFRQFLVLVDLFTHASHKVHPL